METGAARRTLFVLTAVNVLNFYDRSVLGALVEPLRREFGWSDAQIGSLTTTFTIVYAIAGLPLGRLSDTWSRRKLLALGMLAWSALTAVGAGAASFVMLLFSRLGVGIGEAVCAPAGTSWIGDIVPASQRARALARFMLGVPIGVALSYAVTGPIAQAWGWRIAFAAAALPAIVLIPAVLLLPEPPIRGRKAALASPRWLLRLPVFWWIVASGAVVNFILYAFFAFLAAFLTRWHGLSVAQAGWWSGIGTGIAGLAAAFCSGWLGDRPADNLRRYRLRTAAIAALLAAPLMAGAISLPRGNAAAAIALIITGYALLNMYYGLVYSAIQDVVPAELRGTAMSMYFLAMYLCGASFGPLITGKLSDVLAHRPGADRATGLHDAMYVLPILALVLAGVLYAGSRCRQE